MSSANERPRSQPSESQGLRSSAGPPPTPRPRNSTQSEYQDRLPQNDTDTHELPRPRHGLVENPDGTVTINPRSIHSPTYRPLPLPPNTAYRTPSEAVQALNNVREAEARGTASAAANRRPATRGRSPLRTYSPNFPYRGYEQVPVSVPRSSGNEAQDWSNIEVNAIPESQRLHENSPAKCGRCLNPLRGIPSRCQYCHVMNIGDDWAANERFAQAEGRTRPQNQIREAPNHLPRGLTYPDWQRMLREDPHGATDPNYRNALLQPDVLRVEQQQANDLPEYVDENIGDGNLLSAPPLSASQSRNQTSVTSQNQIDSTIASSNFPEPQIHNFQTGTVTRTSAQPQPQIVIPPTTNLIPVGFNPASQSRNQTTATSQNQINSVIASSDFPEPQIHNFQTGTVTRTSAQPQPQIAVSPTTNLIPMGFNPASQSRNQTFLTGQNQVDSKVPSTNLHVPQLHSSQTGTVTPIRAQPRSRAQRRPQIIDPADPNILPPGFDPYANSMDLSSGHVESRVDALPTAFNPYANSLNMSPGHIENRDDPFLQRSTRAPPTQRELCWLQQPSTTMSNPYANFLNMPPDHIESRVDTSLRRNAPAPSTQQQLPWQQHPSTMAAEIATAYNRPHVNLGRACSIGQEESTRVATEAHPQNAVRVIHLNQQEAMLAQLNDLMNNDPYYSDDRPRSPISRPTLPLQPRMPAGPTIPTNPLEQVGTAPTGTQFIGRSGRAEHEIEAIRARSRRGAGTAAGARGATLSRIERRDAAIAAQEAEEAEEERREGGGRVEGGQGAEMEWEEEGEGGNEDEDMEDEEDDDDNDDSGDFVP